MLWLKEGIRANIVSVVISLVVGLYLVEAGLIVFSSDQGQDRAAIAKELGIDYDQRTKLEVLEDLIAEGVDAVPTVHISKLIQIIGTNKEDIDHLLPLGGVSNKTTVLSNESGKYLIYKSDRFGFNNPDNQWDSQIIEWLLTGDSYTHGSSVQPGQEIAGQIRSITGNRAISLGIGGNGPLLEYATLVEYNKTFTPEKVLWIYSEINDINNNLQREKENPLLMQYMEDGFSQNLINRQKEIDNSLEKYIVSGHAQAQAKAQAQLSKTRWIRLSAIRNIIDLDVDVDVDDPLFAKILTKAKARVESRGGELYFIYPPNINDTKRKMFHMTSIEIKLS